MAYWHTMSGAIEERNLTTAELKYMSGGSATVSGGGGGGGEAIIERPAR
jgi:hypothetical protein